MCGLVALLGLQGHAPEPARLDRMVNAIRHRGPDDSGTLIDGPIALGFRRLSIIDLSPAGHQPMQDDEARVSIIFNGEIYNYLELKSELLALGHRFRSTSDSEVLLHAYLQWGRDCVKRCNGMWAFVIADHRQRLLFGSRDRFGIKPLYHARNASLVAFASEIKALLAGEVIAAKPNLQTAANFLVDNRLDDTEATFFEGVQSVPAAHCFEVDASGTYRQWRYWSLDERAAAPADPAAAFAELFEDAMRLHMRSDVPVAVHLSGGLDSTAITCASARIRSSGGAVGELAAFCYMDPQFDEQPYIAATLAQTGAVMTPLSCTPRQLWDCLPDALRAHDEPLHSLTPLVGYQLMKLTAQHGIKVVLNGQGADETLAGYGTYFWAYWQTLLTRGSLPLLLAEVKDWAGANGRGLWPEIAGVIGRFTREALRRVPAYQSLGQRRWRENLSRLDWIDPALRARHTPCRRRPGPAAGARTIDAEQPLAGLLARGRPQLVGVLDRRAGAFPGLPVGRAGVRAGARMASAWCAEQVRAARGDARANSGSGAFAAGQDGLPDTGLVMAARPAARRGAGGGGRCVVPALRGHRRRSHRRDARATPARRSRPCGRGDPRGAVVPVAARGARAALIASEQHAIVQRS